MVNRIAYDMIGKHEGTERFVYLDSKGIATIGKGRNLKSKGLSDAEIDYLYRNDLHDAEEQCGRIFKNFYSLSQARQAALMDMCFNMGENRLRGFKKMIAAVERNDFPTAAKEALDSKWRKDVGDNRSGNVVELLLKG